MKSNLPTGLAQSKKYQIRLGEQTIGTATSNLDQLEIAPARGVDPAKLASTGTRIWDPDENKEVFDVEVVTMLPVVKDFLPPVYQPTSAAVLRDVDTVGAMQDEFLKLYVDSYRSGKLDRKHRRQLRAQMFGESALAAPEEHTALGVQTLAQTLGWIMEGVEHIGELDNPSLAACEPDQTTNETLPDMDLSKFFPISDKDYVRELTALLQYQHQRCTDYRDIGNYITDLSNLRALVTVLAGTGARLVVVNDRLYTHASSLTHQSFVCHQYMPAALVLTHQAVKHKDNNETVAMALNKLVAKFGKSIRASSAVTVPIVFSHIDSVEATESPLPLITRSTLPKIPSVESALPGRWRDASNLLVDGGRLTDPFSSAAIGLTIGKTAPLGTVPKSVTKEEDRAILRLGPELTDVEHAAEIVKILKGGTRWEIPEPVQQAWDAVSVKVSYGTPIAALFASMWTVRPASDQPELVRLLIRARLVTLALLQLQLSGANAIPMGVEKDFAEAIKNASLTQAVLGDNDRLDPAFELLFSPSGMWMTASQAVNSNETIQIDSPMKLNLAKGVEVNTGSPHWCGNFVQCIRGEAS